MQYQRQPRRAYVSLSRYIPIYHPMQSEYWAIRSLSLSLSLCFAVCVCVCVCALFFGVIRAEAGTIFLESNKPTSITSCTFQDSFASYNGGALSGINFHVSNCTFDRCIAFDNGGAVYQRGGKASISSSTFSGSLAYSYAGAVLVSVRLHSQRAAQVIVKSISPTHHHQNTASLTG